MEKIKKVFCGINLTWTKVIIFAIVTALYTALINQVPFLKETSFQDIAISFECWILFGIIIIMNSNSNMDSALKCFVFFLISQPLIYLFEVPFLGWSILRYYKNWIVWTILTLPMGYIGYYLKKGKWWGFIILIPMLLFLGFHYNLFLKETIYAFPKHLLSAMFCAITMYIYGLVCFEKKNARIIITIINTIIIIGMTILALINPKIYNTTLLLSGGEEGIEFDSTYTVTLEDSKYGEAYIDYIESIEAYALNVRCKKAGKTKVILKSPDGIEKVYDVTIKNNTYNITPVNE